MCKYYVNGTGGGLFGGEKKMVKEKLIKIAQRNNLRTTELLDSVSTVKSGVLKERWIYCPCCSENKSRYCGSKSCLEDIKRDGVCHCGLYEKGETI